MTIDLKNPEAAERLHRFCQNRPAIAVIPRIESRLTRAGRFPMEGAAVDDNPVDRRAMPSDLFGLEQG